MLGLKTVVNGFTGQKQAKRNTSLIRKSKLNVPIKNILTKTSSNSGAARIQADTLINILSAEVHSLLPKKV